MSETDRLISALKRCLRTRGITYGKLGKAIGLSESSVKRLFADRSFTIARLERICAVLDMSFADLAALANGSRPQQAEIPMLTLEQERTLARNDSLLACFYLLLNGHETTAIAERLGASQRTMRNWLATLAAAGLLEVKGQAVRLNAKLPIAWRVDGPVRRVYERQVRAEFLQSPFTDRNENLSFHSAELSNASIRIMLRKLERLSMDFAELAALDVQVPARDKVSFAMLAACRPWVFSMFSAYRPRATGT